MMRGRGVRISSRLRVTSGPGIMRLTFEKSIFSLGRTRLAIRNRAQVFPDLGYDTRNVSSGKTARFRPGAWCPRTRSTPAMTRFSIEVFLPSHPKKLSTGSAQFRVRWTAHSSIPEKSHLPGQIGSDLQTEQQQAQSGRFQIAVRLCEEFRSLAKLARFELALTLFHEILGFDFGRALLDHHAIRCSQRQSAAEFLQNVPVGFHHLPSLF